MNKTILIVALIITLVVGVFLVFNFFQKQTKEFLPTQEDKKAEELKEQPEPLEDQIEQLEQEPELSMPSEEQEKAITPSPTEEALVLDCGQDFNCLIQAAKSCELTKVTFALTTEILGIEQTTVTFFEIKGKEENKCLFYLRLEEVEIVYPEDFSPEIIAETESIYQQLKSRDGICRFYPQDLVAMLTKWSEGEFSSGEVSCQLTPEGTICRTEGGDFAAGDCQGTYFEYSL